MCCPLTRTKRVTAQGAASAEEAGSKARLPGPPRLVLFEDIVTSATRPGSVIIY